MESLITSPSLMEILDIAWMDGYKPDRFMQTHSSSQLQHEAEGDHLRFIKKIEGYGLFSKAPLVVAEAFESSGEIHYRLFLTREFEGADSFLKDEERRNYCYDQSAFTIKKVIDGKLMGMDVAYSSLNLVDSLRMAEDMGYQTGAIWQIGDWRENARLELLQEDKKGMIVSMIDDSLLLKYFLLEPVEQSD